MAAFLIFKMQSWLLQVRIVLPDYQVFQNRTIRVVRQAANFAFEI